MRVALGLLLLLCTANAARADQYYSLVGIQCDVRHDRLVVYYKSAANDDGVKLVDEKAANEWEPMQLILEARDDRFITKTGTIEKVCTLHRGAYEIRFGPSVGNGDIYGCAASPINAWVEILLDAVVVVPRRSFETPECQSAAVAPTPTKILSRIVIDGRSREPLLEYEGEDAENEGIAPNISLERTRER